MHESKNLKRFLFWGVASIVIIYLVILAGAIVRSTGAGMGCPDWPKCFGLWIPPTHISQLPPNYQELFSNHGTVFVEPFNPIKTWTEYINRLIGALSGFIVFIMLIHAFLIRKQFPKAFYWTSFAFALLLFQGWLGAQVVYTNLTPHMITYHMLLAMVIVGALIFAVVSPFQFPKTSYHKFFLLMLFLMFIQLTLGVLVREQIDATMKKMFYEYREQWLSFVDSTFIIHRTFSWIVLGASLFFLWKLKNTSFSLHAYIQIIGVLVLFTTGVLFQYFQFPAFAQPVHLLTTTLMIGNLFYGYSRT